MNEAHGNCKCKDYRLISHLLLFPSMVLVCPSSLELHLVIVVLHKGGADAIRGDGTRSFAGTSSNVSPAFVGFEREDEKGRKGRHKKGGPKAALCSKSEQKLRSVVWLRS